jgi:hypothetical protein
MAGPWDSPKLVTLNRVPKVLPLMRGLSPNGGVPMEKGLTQALRQAL